jgi:hypothetical protein
VENIQIFDLISRPIFQVAISDAYELDKEESYENGTKMIIVLKRR